LADKQLPSNAEFVHGIGKRKSECQKRYEKLDSLWTKWTEYEDKLFAIGNNRRSMYQNRQGRYIHADERRPHGEWPAETGLQCPACGQQ